MTAPAPADFRRRTRHGTPPEPAAPVSWGRSLLAAHAWLVYAFLYFPIAVLVFFSFNRARQTARWEGFTVEWYAKLADNALLLRAVKNSLFVACVTTVVATLIGTLVALALARYDFRGRGATRGTIYLPIVIPEVVLGAALVALFGAIELRLSIWTVVLAHVTFSISYVAIVVGTRLAGFDRSLEEAALDLGAPPLATFVRVTLPLILPGIVAAALLVFTVSIDDYLITSFVAGVGATTLPLQIYSMLKVGVTPEVNAVSTLLIVGTLVLIVAAQRLQLGRPPSERGGVP